MISQSPNVAGRHTLWRKEQRCPPAHFCVYGICIITNNAEPRKYIPHHSFIISHIHLRSVRSPKRNGGLYPATIYHFYAIYNPTNNGVYIKYRTQKPLRRFAFLLLRQDIITSRSKTKSKISFSRRKVCQPLRAAFAIPYILKDLSLKSTPPGLRGIFDEKRLYEIF